MCVCLCVRDTVRECVLIFYVYACAGGCILWMVTRFATCACCVSEFVCGWVGVRNDVRKDVIHHFQTKKEHVYGFYEF